jgi:hypothetical protein
VALPQVIKAAQRLGFTLSAVHAGDRLLKLVAVTLIVGR